jgi:DNA repair protein RadD
VNEEVELSFGDDTASEAPILTSEVSNEWYDVEDIEYFLHQKRGAAADAPRTLRVNYVCGLRRRFSEWICLEHQGWARERASRWWQQRSNQPVPLTIEEAVVLAQCGALAVTERIEVRPADGKDDWPTIAGCELGEIPTRLVEPPEEVWDDDDIPF